MKEFLFEYFDIHELINFSKICKTTKFIADPLSELILYSNKNKERKLTEHLKKVGAINLLYEWKNLDVEDIDSRLGYSVKKLSDF